MQVIDNLIPIKYQEEIKNTLLGYTFPWYFSDDITFGKSLLEKEQLGTPHPANAHLFRQDCKTHSGYFDLIAPIAAAGAEIAGYKFNDIYQARSFLQYPLNNNFVSTKTDRLHIDLPFDHLVVLYYVMDSDGDTLIVNKTRTSNTAEYHTKVEDHEIIQRVTPMQGRAVIFDGKYYHTSEQPQSNMRCIINFDII
jgi:hypothetical protein